MYCPHCIEMIDNNAAVCPHCGKATNAKNVESALPIGSILANRYYVGSVIGQGGFGITYVGCDTKLNKKIAIKEYYPSALVSRLSSHSTNLTVTAGDAGEVYEREKQKFIREAYLLAEFAGDRNIVSVSDVLTDHNTAYIVMEYVDGETMDAYIRRRGRLSFNEAFTMMQPMIRTLGKVHAKGLIHRDISPSNIMVQEDGHVTLLDFGAAREYGNAEEKSMSVILKHGYAPAEQYQSRGPQGPWTDVYAICSTMYKVITGITPPSAVDRMVGSIMKKPSELGAIIDSKQEEVLLKGMAVFQNERYSSMEDLLNAWNGKEPVAAVAPQAEPVTPVAPNVAANVTPVEPTPYVPTELFSPGAVGNQNVQAQATPVQNPVPEAAQNARSTAMFIPEMDGNQPAMKIENKPAPEYRPPVPPQPPTAEPPKAEPPKVLTPPHEPVPEKKSNGKTGLIIGIVVAVLALIGVIAFFLTRIGSNVTDYSYVSSAREANERASAYTESQNEDSTPAETVGDSDSGESESNVSTITVNEHKQPGSVQPDYLYNFSSGTSLEDILMGCTVNTADNNAYSDFTGDIGEIFGEYSEKDLDGDGEPDTIYRKFVDNASEKGYYYLFEFSSGANAYTPTFETYSPNEGETIQYYDSDGDNICEILVTHLVGSTGGVVATQAYHFCYTDNAWVIMTLIDDSGVSDYGLKSQIEELAAQKGLERYTISDFELCWDGIAILVDYGWKDGPEVFVDPYFAVAARNGSNLNVTYFDTENIGDLWMDFR